MWDNVEKSFMRGKINMIDKDQAKKISICASLVRHSQSLKLDPIIVSVTIRGITWFALGVKNEVFCIAQKTIAHERV